MSVPELLSPPSPRPLETRAPWGVTLLTHRPGESLPATQDRSDALLLVHVVQGSGTLELPPTRVLLEPGSAVLVPPTAAHRLEQDPDHPLGLEVLRIDPLVLSAAALTPGDLPEGELDLGPDRQGRIEALVKRLNVEQQRGRPFSGALAVSLTLRLLAELAAEVAPSGRSDQEPSSGWFEGDSTSRVRAYVEDLEDHFFEATNLDAAAASLGLSRRRFTQLFREVTGNSWLTHVRGLRIRHAQRLLADPARTVLSIAFECGFEDLSTFYRAFKREVGVSPNHWRQNGQA